MPETTVTKIDSRYSPTGPMGQKQLATSVHMSMRLWDDLSPGDSGPETRRDYEIIGYVLSGKAELEVEGQTVRLEPGNSYVVPRGARHRFSILERFSAVEVTAPPAILHDRDAAPGG